MKILNVSKIEINVIETEDEGVVYHRYSPNSWDILVGESIESNEQK